ncbi:uncharacterized protein LOC142356677, partial [Convolutriloba macropyga]|uniref:uncharacterized protein LOC142356677 n=1 Tax=Convolutriloba macropyga TaxID=536237 RepID=UPI003F527153
NSWPINCPIQSEAIPGSEDRCYQYLQISKGFKEAIDYCSHSFDGRGTLMGVSTENKSWDIARHFQLEHNALLWLRFSKIEIRTGKEKKKHYLEEPYCGDARSYKPIKFESIQWRSGQPQNRDKDDEMCGCFKGEFSYLMHDCVCARRQHFICEITDPSIFEPPVPYMC